MAVCEANISNINNFSTDSGLQVGEDITGSDRSKGESSEKAIFIQAPKSPSRKRGRSSSGSCDQKKRHSPRLLNVKSKTRPHGGPVDFGDTSEDSDPNIHLNGIPDLDDPESDLALLEEEEKQRVLLAKDSETGNEHMSEKEMVAIAIYNSLEKKGDKNAEASSRAKKVVQHSQILPVKHESSAVIIQSNEKNETVTVTSADGSYSGVATRLRKRQRNVIGKETMTCLKKSNETCPRLSTAKKLFTKTPIQVNIPPTSLSVPNPILMSPQGQTSSVIKQEQIETKKVHMKRKDNSCGAELQGNILITSATKTPDNHMSIQLNETEGDKKLAVPPKSSKTNKNLNTNTNSVSFKVESDNCSGPISSMPQRKRIFSIDFDPEGFDFDSTMDETCVDYALPDVNELPPIAPSSLSQNPKPNTVSSSSTFSRDRAMSFELFSFDQNPSSSIDSLLGKSTDILVGRPRGDSIIFDPISFKDGGIHEVDALRKFRCNSLSLEGPDEFLLMNNSSEFVAPQQNINTGPPAHRQLKPVKNVNKLVPNPVSVQSKVLSSRSKTTNARKSISKIIQRQNKRSHLSKPHVTLTVVTGSALPSCTEDTIHMPQGSAAAAAAAASMPSQILPSSLNGTISHTACPMELLNRGGRIGIYLPEARRERISKFHSKRKMRIWRKRIKYDCRKKLADSRPRIKGRFVKSLEED